jgi:hypothetical protein
MVSEMIHIARNYSQSADSDITLHKEKMSGTFPAYLERNRTMRFPTLPLATESFQVKRKFVQRALSL